MRALNRQQRRAAILKFVILYVITVILILIPFVFLADFPDQQNKELAEQLKTCRASLKTMSTLTNAPVRLDETLKDLHGEYVKIYEEIDTTVKGMISDLGTDEGDWTGELIREFVVKVDKLERLQRRMKDKNENLEELLPQ